MVEHSLSRDSILSPLESVDLDIEFQALTSAARGRHVLSRDSILSLLESVDLDIEFQALTTAARGRHVLSRDSILSPLASVNSFGTIPNTFFLSPRFPQHCFRPFHPTACAKAGSEITVVNRAMPPYCQI